MTAVEAAGGVLWRRGEAGVQVAVVHRPRYDDWSLPKGKLDPAEPWVAGAVREVGEETGFSVEVGRSLGVSRYRVPESPKTVRWWAMRAVSGCFEPGDETDALQWLPVAQAASLVTAGSDVAVLQQFSACTPETSTVLLVRHGRAGDRDQWTGDDDQRPLDDVGREQAAALAEVLPLWGPVSVLSAPALRCLDTVRPVAARLDLPVVVDDSLSEGRSPRLPGRLRELGAAGRTVVVCSQGGAIPEAVEDLAGAGGLGLQDVAAHKGSLWALSFADGRLVDADHTDRIRR